jgi:hypothetical protein
MELVAQLLAFQVLDVLPRGGTHGAINTLAFNILEHM